MTDWVTISSLATAGGTLVLAAATFGSVRSANRASRVAEEALLVGIRPLVVPSRLPHPPGVNTKWLSAKLTYGDHQGRQRVVSRFSLLPCEDGVWFVAVGRHWNVDRPIRVKKF